MATRAGRYTRHRLSPGSEPFDVALDATLRAAAARGGASARRLPAITADDLRYRIRRHRSSFSLVVVVDNSYSVHADHMVEKTKGLAHALLDNAVSNGDRIGIVTFRADAPHATVALPLTRSAKLARRRLEAIPVASRTPLASAIRLAGRLLRQELLKRRSAVPLVVAITDGLPTLPLRPGGDPLRDLLAEARVLRRRKITTVVADGSDRSATLGGCGPELAEAAGGRWMPFEELVPDAHD